MGEYSGGRGGSGVNRSGDEECSVLMYVNCVELSNNKIGSVVKIEWVLVIPVVESTIC